MKLCLLWKDIDGNVYKLGTLSKDEKYIFILDKEEYQNAMKNGCAGIGNLVKENQESDTLFQFFKERIPGKESPRLKIFLNLFNLEYYDDMELLRRSEGRVTTDRFFLKEV